VADLTRSLPLSASGKRFKLSANATIARPHNTPLIINTHSEEIGAGSASCNRNLSYCLKKLKYPMPQAKA